MAQLARNIMTPSPACCGPNATLDEIAKLMVQNDCGEIPIIDVNDCVVGVITDRDIVCRVVAEGMNPTGHTAASCMTQPVVCVREDDAIEDVLSTWKSIRSGASRSSRTTVYARASSLRPIWLEWRVWATWPSSYMWSQKTRDCPRDSDDSSECV